MSVLHKIIVTHQYLEPKPGDFKRDFCPFQISLLNALEDITKIKVSQGKLTEVNDRYWEFEYRNASNRMVKLTLRMTDETLGDKYEEENYGGKKIKGPTFK